MTKRISKKQLNNFLTKNFNIVETTGIGLEEAPDSYVSKIDNSYLTFVGLEKDIKFLLKLGITEQLQNTKGSSGGVVSIGFNPVEQKWYGWSHRAIFGFTIGSECKKGHCHWQPRNEEEFKEYCFSFWGDTYASDDKVAKITTVDGERGVLVSYTYTDEVPNKSLRGKLSENFTPFPEKWGKGEWIAETLNDAKQMAIDFSNGVG